MKSKSLICALLLLLSVSAKGFDFQQDGICYNILDDRKSVEVTYHQINDNAYSGDIVIPTTVTHDGVSYNVTGIGSAAFFKCPNLTSIHIPSSVTAVGVSAFFGCSSLTTISLPDRITNLGTNAFANCVNLRTIRMPRNINYIWKGIFKGCISLREVTMPGVDQFVRFEKNVFDDCKNLTAVYVPVGSKERFVKMLPSRFQNILQEKAF